MSTHNICSFGELLKSILQLSSNTLLICATDSVMLTLSVMFYIIIMIIIMTLFKEEAQLDKSSLP